MNRGQMRQALTLLGRARDVGRAEGRVDANLLTALALAHKGCGDLEPALVLFRDALTLSPESAHTWLHYGRALREAKRPSDALAAMRRALDFDPRSAKAWSVLSNLQREQGLLDEARVSAREALSLDPPPGEEELLHGRLRELRAAR